MAKADVIAAIIATVVSCVTPAYADELKSSAEPSAEDILSDPEGPRQLPLAVSETEKTPPVRAMAQTWSRRPAGRGRGAIEPVGTEPARAAQTSKSCAKSCASARGGRATQPWRVAAVQGGLNERAAARPTHDPRVLVPAM